MIHEFLTGLGVSVITASPLIFWGIKKARYSFSNSFCKSMKSKFLTEEELKKLTPKLRKTDYWNILNQSKDSFDYEEKLEEYFIQEENKILRISPPKLREYLSFYSSEKKRIKTIKMLIEAIINKKDKEKVIKHIHIKEDELVNELSKINNINQAFNIILKRNEGRFLSLKKFFNHGLISIEFGLDKYFYNKIIHKFAEFEEISKKMYKTYLYEKILRLRNLDYKPNTIIELLMIKNERLKKILTYTKSYLKKILGHEISTGFQEEMIKYFESLSTKNPLGPGVVLETYFKKKRELSMLKKIWRIKE